MPARWQSHAQPAHDTNTVAAGKAWCAKGCRPLVAVVSTSVWIASSLQIREQMATKAELESLRHDINLVADGFAQTQNRLSETTNLLKRCLTSA